MPYFRQDRDYTLCFYFTLVVIDKVIDVTLHLYALVLILLSVDLLQWIHTNNASVFSMLTGELQRSIKTQRHHST